METINAKTVSPEITPIKKVLDTLLIAQEEGNLEQFSKCFAQDENTLNIGTDLDEIWYGWYAFYEWMTQAIKTKPDYTIAAKDTRIQLSQCKEVAWYSQLLDTCFETKGEPFRLEGFRHTGVLEKRDGNWLIVQSHISVPDNTLPPTE
ncbi:nuclear transport factor 2 family protein [Carboxylicivirga mesophila]|uniref:Nuclear transport factor 2 family protein n=1 Tax=Carboxylicivirga mesophila TaxID=1166478 RepID=A0ABS5KBN2_9BACT|nr:nuclear transport factor 2 family protein [Carboxylicivirga mesophila]MBS2212443.1 nuclear transport factor 2 family protein [Carboxylicivirga mesophila]